MSFSFLHTFNCAWPFHLHYGIKSPSVDVYESFIYLDTRYTSTHTLHPWTHTVRGGKKGVIIDKNGALLVWRFDAHQSSLYFSFYAFPKSKQKKIVHPFYHTIFSASFFHSTSPSPPSHTASGFFLYDAFTLLSF